MNYVIGILLLVISIYIGYSIAKKYDKKLNFYYQFNNFNNILKNEMLFSQKTIKKIILENYLENDYFYKKLMNYFNDNLVNVDCKFLDKEEILFYDTYLSTIGQGDLTAQIGYIEKTANYLAEKYNQSLSEQKKYKSLYTKIGFLIGLMLLIIFL